MTYRVVIRLLAATALAACTQGPEGGGQRLGAPATTPATDKALAAAHSQPARPCIRNLTDRQVDFTLESDGRLRQYSLHGGEALRFRDAGAALVRFTSVAGHAPGPLLRSRSYLIDLEHGAGCTAVFRLDTAGTLDLFQRAAP